MSTKAKPNADAVTEGRDKHFMDVDWMVNEGLGGGKVTEDNGLIGETTTDSMKQGESGVDNHSEDQ